MSTTQSMIDSYDDNHIYSHVVTPDEWRPRWRLSDVPEFVRIDHPDRPAFKAQGGGTSKSAMSRAGSKAALPFSVGRPKKTLPVYCEFQGVTHEFDNPSQASEALGFLLRPANRRQLVRTGQCFIARVGALLRLKTFPTEAGA